MKTILSIQSAVTAGFVGNSVAGPVLTALGHHPMMIDTVQLAAHPGYGKRAGGAIPAPIINDVLCELSTLIAPAHIDSVITGYLGHADQIDPITTFLDEWEKQEDSLYILDPVLGDSGRLYVTPELADGLVSDLLPKADIITPNQFELFYLANHEQPDGGASDSSAHQAAQLLIDQHGLQAVIATGVVTASGVGDLLVTRDGGTDWHPAQAGARNVAGGGDLLTALLAGHLTSGQGIHSAFQTACHQAQTVLAASPTSRDLALLESLSVICP